jgi:cytoskeleton protein RodZ
MTEPMAEQDRAPDPAPQTAASALTAGAILRAARERQGVHIAMLAAAIKVSPRKLDALENDRYNELPDATFTRALAQTVCRALKIDVQPVLAKLPQAGGLPLEQVSAGLNTPFRERPGRADVGSRLPTMPLVWAGVALLVAAAAIALWPAGGFSWMSGLRDAVSVGPASDAAAPAVVASPTVEAAPASALPAPAGVASEPAATAAATAPVVETVHSAPPAEPTGASSRGATLVAADASWVEILDGNGQTLLSRIVQPGETVNVDGALPLRLKIGNARSTQLVFRGQAVELDAFTRDNIARVELK